MTGSTRRLSEVARHLVIPEGIVTSVFPRVYRRLREVGVSFDVWQQGLGQIALGCRENGKYAASIGGVTASIPRQVGKTFTFGNLMIGLCLEFPGLRVLWTSHHGRTTTGTFRSMQSMVRKKAIWPHVAQIREANGEQEIVFVNGSIIMFGARAQGFGRGMESIDVEVFDEAQILGVKALEDMVPATNAAKHEHGGLVIFIGTPPRPTDDGAAFTTKRKKALDGLARDQVYVEISAEPGTDPDDQSKFATFNPSYPHRTPLESMLRMRENIPDDEAWSREAMGIWPEDDDEDAKTYVIEPADWAKRANLEPKLLADCAIGIDMAKGRGGVTISAATKRVGGGRHLEVVFHGSQSGVVALVSKIVAKQSPRAVVIARNSPAASLAPQLEAAGIKVTLLTEQQVAQACGSLTDDLPEGLISHTGDPLFADALESAEARDLGQAGAWVWDRSGDDPIDPIMAGTLALYGLWVEAEEELQDSSYEDSEFIML